MQTGRTEMDLRFDFGSVFGGFDENVIICSGLTA